MKLQTQLSIPRSGNPLDYTSRLLLLGSCFVENIGNKLEYYKFRNLQNPFGILFSPMAIETIIKRVVAQELYTASDLFFHNERWQCYEVHSAMSDPGKEAVLQRLNGAVRKTYQELALATHVIITLGTAWTYRNLESNSLVANCHKVPQNEFTKELREVPDIVASLENSVTAIRSVNPGVQIIFTVSPVRHLKDGFTENLRSKAHLITALHLFLSIQENTGELHYFPAYELMMDELRDYRFYGRDMVHPNGLAIDYIWGRFLSAWISEKCLTVMDTVDAVQKGLHHRPFNPGSQQHLAFQNGLQEKIAYLEEHYPFMEFNM